MKQLPLPLISSRDLFHECANGVPNALQRNTYLVNYPQVEQTAANFIAASATKSWCDLPRVPRGNPDLVVAGTLSKIELMALYSTYMVPPSAPARHWYDEIKVTANGKCPFCGGIGQVETLDHYLPKANFPQYSVLPANLVPCCRDCNTGKGSAFPSTVEEQAIHPYLDEEHFFVQKWIDAVALDTDPTTISFEAVPPTDWSNTDQCRAISHFEEYDLAKRFSIEAATELSCLIDLRQGILRGQSENGFRQYLFEMSNSLSLPINGWRRSMYGALSDAAWFHSKTF